MGNYEIIKSYSTKQSLIAHHSNELLWSRAKTEAEIYSEADVIVRKDDDHLYQVDLQVNVKAMKSGSNVCIYDIHLIYSSLVWIDVDVEDKEHVLMVDVPDVSLKAIRKMVQQMTADAGYRPLKIKGFDFEERFQSSKI